MSISLKRQSGLTRFGWLVGFVLGAMLFGTAAQTRAQDLEAVLAKDEIKILDSVIETEALRPVYAARRNQPIWIDRRGTPTDKGRLLIARLSASEEDGLDPRAYGVGKLEDRLGSASQAAEMEVFLSAQLLHYAADLRAGRMDPRVEDPGYVEFKRPLPGNDALAGAADAGDLEAYLQSLGPRREAYKKLRDSLKQWRALSAGPPWPIVPPGPSLKKGMNEDRVAILRQRLIFEGALSADAQGPAFDDALESGVRSFQARHGLPEDGVVGAATLAELNVPVDQRIRQIIVNMERFRWLPDQPGPRFITVNIADFKLRLVENDHVLSILRIVVGQRYRRTPVFQSQIERIEVNPYWTVPPMIARRDILPRIAADPAYLTRQGFTLFENWQAGARAIDPKSVDWRKLAAKGQFPYKLRQDPGPLNALGQYKFVFPNEFGVYLHDTSARSVFEKERRMLSSGCIRVETPRVVADFLRAGSPEITAQQLDDAEAQGTHETINLATPIPIVVHYATAWVDEFGTLQFRSDIYGRDANLAAALRQSQALGN